MRVRGETVKPANRVRVSIRPDGDVGTVTDVDPGRGGDPSPPSRQVQIQTTSTRALAIVETRPIGRARKFDGERCLVVARWHTLPPRARRNEVVLTDHFYYTPLSQQAHQYFTAFFRSPSGFRVAYWEFPILQARPRRCKYVEKDQEPILPGGGAGLRYWSFPHVLTNRLDVPTANPPASTRHSGSAEVYRRSSRANKRLETRRTNGDLSNGFQKLRRISPRRRAAANTTGSPSHQHRTSLMHPRLRSPRCSSANEPVPRLGRRPIVIGQGVCG